MSYPICECDVCIVLNSLHGVVAELTRQRDEARANARELAHAYEHDSRPRSKVVAESLAYPADSAKPNAYPAKP